MKNMSDKEDRLSHRVHEAFRPLREQITRVSADFGKRVVDGIHEFLARDKSGPSLLGALGAALIEIINLGTSAAENGSKDIEGGPDA